MLSLDTVTLCCVDTINPALALRALALSRREIRFARSMLLTDLRSAVDVPAGIDIVPVEGIASRPDYSAFIVKSLLPHIATPHVLMVQWDGYIIDASAWDDAFLDMDYIGARWFWQEEGSRVGNGGFSLRSRRLLEALLDPRIVPGELEDETICRTFRPLLERDHGIRFADETTADRFSFEVSHPTGPTFGFHALYNFWRVMPVDALAGLAPALPDAIARSPQCMQLLRNCCAMQLWPAVVAIAERMLAARPIPHEYEVLGLLARAQQRVGKVVANRNQPCPCGSGQRYKRCHGHLAAL
jgi:hypothetical protein